MWNQKKFSDKESKSKEKKSFKDRLKNVRKKMIHLNRVNGRIYNNNNELTRASLDHANWVNQLNTQQAVNQSIAMINPSMGMFSDSEDYSLDSQYKKVKDKVSSRDKVKALKSAIKISGTNIRGIVTSPKQVRSLKRAAVINYDKNGKPIVIKKAEFQSKAYPLKERIRNIKDSISAIPDFYKADIVENRYKGKK